MNNGPVKPHLPKLIFLVIVWQIIICPFMVYGYSKTYGKGASDCMINYVNDEYPNGCTYMVNGSLHIDGCDMQEDGDLVVKLSEVNGCMIPEKAYINVPYCYISLLLEKNVGENKMIR